ncbi:MAG: ABC transporter ATP-binding protein, partial [Candidatus Latescibacterota bacterium]
MDKRTRTALGGTLARAGGLAAALLAAACSSQVEDNIDKLIEGGEDAEAARMALSMARASAVGPLIDALHNARHSARARADMVDALFDLYLREKDPRILAELKAAINDGQAPVRQMAIKCLGDLGTTAARSRRRQIMLEVVEMSKHYGEVKAVQDLSLTIQLGEIFTMLGANGAGKTTTLMVALGFTEPTAGTVRICGIDVTRDPLEAKRHVAYVSENVMLYGNFTARQNLDFFTKLGGRQDATAADYNRVLERVGLQPEAFDRRVKGFSKGMRQKLGIAIA